MQEVVFTETRKEIEALRREETDLLETAGEDPHAHSGEEYRQELRSIDSTIDKEYSIIKQYARIGINSNMMVKIYYLSKTTENFTPETDITIIK